jgi:nucleotide-binding universal stress UspA family protein
MFRNVLVGVDGRQGGRDAIALARQLAAPDARLTLAYVWGPFLGRGAAELSELERTQAHQLLERERIAASVEAQFVTKGESPVGVGLHQLAEERSADLLVVGSTRHALLGRVLMGDDCRAALDGAPCAVAVAPRGYAHAPHPLQRVGVGYDGSLESEHALAVARDLGAVHGGEVRAYRVVSLQEVRDEKPVPADWPAAIDKLIERHADELAQLEGVYGVVTYGGPREELAQFGKALDLLITGSRGYGPLGRLFHGSVSRYLLAHAACPLLVLPRAADSELEPEQTKTRERMGATA